MQTLNVTHHASPSLIEIFPGFKMGCKISLLVSAETKEFISTFLFIAAVAEGDKSFAITCLNIIHSQQQRNAKLYYLTRGISFAYRMERNPVAERASRMVNL